MLNKENFATTSMVKLVDLQEKHKKDLKEILISLCKGSPLTLGLPQVEVTYPWVGHLNPR
jgi:hypothetical protein